MELYDRYIDALCDGYDAKGYILVPWSITWRNEGGIAGDEDIAYDCNASGP